MTAKELMNPRFEIIADYPSSPFIVGDVIAYDGMVKCPITSDDKQSF